MFHCLLSIYTRSISILRWCTNILYCTPRYPCLAVQRYKEWSYDTHLFSFQNVPKCAKTCQITGGNTVRLLSLCCNLIFYYFCALN